MSIGMFPCAGCRMTTVDYQGYLCPDCRDAGDMIPGFVPMARLPFDPGSEFAAPGDNQQDVWRLFFHDRDCGEQIFMGPNAEKEAWEAWDRYAPSYNVNLFRQVRMRERPSE